MSTLYAIHAVKESRAIIVPASPAMPPVSPAVAVAASSAASSGKPDEEFPDLGPISSALARLTGNAGSAAPASAALAPFEGAAAVVAPPVVLFHRPVNNTVQCSELQNHQGEVALPQERPLKLFRLFFAA